MAVSEIEFKFTWEDNNFFKMEEKILGGEWHTVVEITENSKLPAIAECLKSICKENIAAHLEDILNDMMA